MNDTTKRVRSWKMGKALKVESAIVRRMCSLQDKAIKDKMHSSEITQEFLDIMASLEDKRLPYYSRHALHVMQSLLFGWSDRGMNPHTE